MKNIQYITQKIAQQIDKELMDPALGGFSIDQLMELAGLSVAECVLKCFPAPKYQRVLVCAGPGNNGGDALIAARHLVRRH
jgi:NAD(P)H-hydrate epimerase